MIVWVSILHLWKFYRNVSFLFLNVPGCKFDCNPLTPAVFFIVKFTDALCDYWHCRSPYLPLVLFFLQIVEWCTIGASNWQYRFRGREIFGYHFEIKPSHEHYRLRFRVEGARQVRWRGWKDRERILTRAEWELQWKWHVGISPSIRKSCKICCTDFSRISYIKGTQACEERGWHSVGGRGSWLSHCQSCCKYFMSHISMTSSITLGFLCLAMEPIISRTRGGGWGGSCFSIVLVILPWRLFY